MKNLREVNDDILKEWLEFREETILCYLNEEDKKHGLFQTRILIMFLIFLMILEKNY